MSTSPAQTPYAEPWLRGTHTDVPPAARAVLHALELAHDDVKKWTEGLTAAELHATPLGLRSIAAIVRHIGGSVDRILTYAEGGLLSAGQLASLKAEESGNESLPTLLAGLDAALGKAAERVRALAGSDLDTPRTVGRKQLPTTLGGALIHVADHTQRHVGQVITTAKVLKALRG